MQNKIVKVCEATLIAGVSGVLFMVMIYATPNCAPIRGFDVNTSTFGKKNTPFTITVPVSFFNHVFSNTKTATC